MEPLIIAIKLDLLKQIRGALRFREVTVEFGKLKLRFDANN